MTDYLYQQCLSCYHQFRKEEANKYLLRIVMGNLYKDEFGGLQKFNNLVFKKLFDEAWELSDKKLEEYCSEFAEKINLSNESIERIKSWRKGKATPEDLDLVMAIAKALGCSQKDLLISTFVDAKRHQIEMDNDRMIINRLQEMVKGVSDGIIEFNCLKNPIEKDTRSDILGIYGQNGSGKTTLLEALHVAKLAMMGRAIPYSTFGSIIAQGTDSARMSITFQISNIYCEINDRVNIL